MRFGKRAREAREDREVVGVRGRPPFLLGIRSSTPFIALTVGLGVMVDLAGYGLVVPVIPFRLEALGYDEVGAKTGWLVAAYAAGLIVSSPPIAYIGATMKNRRLPLIFFLLFMAGAIVLFMETASYTALVISRVLQGISGTGVWTLGLALVTDSVPEARVGIVMGYVMIGFSVGQLIGPPIGGVLYERLGYRAPFVFALCLVFADMVLRLLVVEKHVAVKWVEAGLVDIPNFEAPGYLSPAAKEKLAKAEGKTVEELSEPTGVQSQEQDPTTDKKEATTWTGFLTVCTSMRPVTLFLLTALNGITLGGLLDSAMTLYLENQYGMNSLGAGLTFMGLVVPTLFVSPIAGWACDRWGAKGIAVFGVALSIVAFPLLIIRGPLPLFIFFLVLLGISLSSFLTPVTHDLSVVVSETPGLPSTYAYGIFNMMYSIGSFVGPIIAGQVINAVEIRQGWMVMIIICTVLSVVLLPFCYIYIGGRVSWRWRKQAAEEGNEVEMR
ncbi:major facilitator superfamily domain-containing protein [Leucosporidium creatinivorum]|uniref:Major facilitator superfamily domain-containing protein n=1 Tax=Leucosporidium creatinivorum TaxID=106004 RepID=A0A1Y2FTP8_9BASI|nr:major facilitator superfamily domain-containing protein [Leucosporidium creatinivorum]